MTYRLLALSIDGTLLKDNARISRQTKDAIEFVKKKGVYVTLVTSRSFASARRVAKSLKISNDLITGDGAFIASSVDKPLFSRRIRDDKAIQIVQILEQFDCRLRIMYETDAIGNKEKTKGNLIAKMTIGVGDSFFYPTTFTHAVSEEMVKREKAPQKIQVEFFETKEKKRAMEQLEEVLFGIQSIEVTPNKINFMSDGVSKASSLQLLGRHLGIKPQEMVVVGVDDGDVEMVDLAGLGVSMGNGTDGVKEVADWITRSNEQNGVSYLIREVFRKQLRERIK